jgi:putative membrane protein
MRVLTVAAAIGMMSGSAAAPAMAQTSPANPAAAATAAQREPAKADRDFVDQAGHGGLAEIELSKLAQKSANPDVRSFAERMIADHSKIDARLTAIAKADGAAVPQTLDVDHQKLRDKLAGEHDGTFDRDYARAMVADHDEAIKLFQQQEQSGRDPQLKEFARNTLPTLQQHRAMAAALAKKLNETAAK